MFYGGYFFFFFYCTLLIRKPRRWFRVTSSRRHVHFVTSSPAPMKSRSWFEQRTTIYHHIPSWGEERRKQDLGGRRNNKIEGTIRRQGKARQGKERLSLIHSFTLTHARTYNSHTHTHKKKTHRYSLFLPTIFFQQYNNVHRTQVFRFRYSKAVQLLLLVLLVLVLVLLVLLLPHKYVVASLSAPSAP